MKNEIRIGIVGLGSRGKSLTQLLADMKDVKIVQVCDEYEDRVLDEIKFLKEEKNIEATGTLDYRELVKNPDIDAVCIFCSWEMHVPIAVAAMREGKAVGLEVGGAYSIRDCERLVEVQEETKAPFMLLENCCYDRIELMIMNMVRQGVFGEIVHCTGGYGHDLRSQISAGEKERHYRLRNYLKRNCDNYPTHQLGPICKVLDINRGNRMVALSSMASKAAGLNEYNRGPMAKEEKLADAKFAQGDIVTTIIKCAGGETISLVLDTTLPRPFYSRNYTVRGTKGMYNEDTKSIVVEENQTKDESISIFHKQIKDNIDEYKEKYESEIWKEYDESDVEDDHGGMDYILLRAFVEMIKNDEESPIDVYDAAAVMSISVLTEMSIARGGAAVDIPDFTGGKWVNAKNKKEWKYSLDK